MKIIFLIIFILADLLSKKIITTSIALNSSIYIFSFLDIVYIKNYGIAFGLFSGILPIWFILIITIIIISILLYLILISSNQIEKWAILLILAGGVSNLIDRIINKYVLDFIYLHYNDFYWPAFNLADTYIFIGVLLIITQTLKKSKKNDEKHTKN